MLKSRNYLFFLIPGIVMMLGAFLFNQYNTFTLDEIAKKTGLKIDEKSERCKALLDSIQPSLNGSDYRALNQYYDSEKIALYRYRGDTLVYWNNAQTPREVDLKSLCKPQGIVQLKHGYYLYSLKTTGTGRSLALCLIKPLFEIQNKYLKNNFTEWTGIYEDIDIKQEGEHSVYLGNEKLFSIQGNEEFYSSDRLNNSCFLFFLLGLIFVLLSVLLRIQKGITFNKLVLILLFVSAFRMIMIYFKWPEFFYRSDLFDLHEFGNAQSFLNAYLGDILINSALLLFFSAGIQWQNTRAISKTGLNFYLALLVGLLFFINYQFNHCIMSMVSNSTLSFDFLSIFNIKASVFVAVIALGSYSLALFICTNRLIAFFETGNKNGGLKFFGIILGICLFQQLLFGSDEVLNNYWTMGLATMLFLMTRFEITNISYRLGFHILLVSLVSAVILDANITKNLKSELNLLSSRLSERQDATLENEFQSVPFRISKDERLKTLISFLPNTQKEIALLLKQKYFGSYFDRYELEFSLFDEMCNPLLLMKDPRYMNLGYFEDQISYFSDTTIVDDLFFVENYKPNTRYIGKIKLQKKTLVVLMDAKNVEELGSFPDLLLDQSQQKQDKLKGLSYGVYRAGQVVNQFGDFNFPYFLVDSVVLASSGSEYKHHYFTPEEGTTVIISEHEKTLTEKFTFNSYLFLFFSFIGFSAYYVYSFLFNAFLKTSTLTQRIQTIIILLLLFAMSAVGITSSRLVSRQFANDNKKQLSEKTNIIINELLGQFSSQTLFDGSQQELINQKLIDYARLFNTDVSLFDRSGFLVNTSQPKLYELGLTADLMNPDAYWKLKQNETSSTSEIEKAGTLNYLSQYTPIYNAQKELQGFINLPYFARQSDLVTELSGIISALINVYVILFILSIVTGLVLSGYITQPLRIIKQQISRITLGQRNETISWQSDDEIGKLVSEYNQMLVKLEQSANLLAQSERESAWREMAKQVAHEIKNPLTPMKLNLQYLQHVMKSDPDDFKEKFEKASAGIIEQIDSLANIATEFSNFAKLPGTQLEKINLVELIRSAVQLFDKHKKIVFSNLIPDPEIMVQGDKDQCLRVLNNIFKNAVQALEDTPDPEIVIIATSTENRVVISITDNGCGIPEELKQVLFTPNFTTKTTGSGLGLAMVKNIMQGFGGKVWFESNQGKGAVFYLEFSLA